MHTIRGPAYAPVALIGSCIGQLPIAEDPLKSYEARSEGWPLYIPCKPICLLSAQAAGGPWTTFSPHLRMYGGQADPEANRSIGEIGETSQS